MIKCFLKISTLFTVSVSHPSLRYSTKFPRPFILLLNHANSSASYKFLFSNLLKNQRVDEARKVLDGVPTTDVYLYTMMLNGYTQNHRLHDALKLFYEMPLRDTITWNSMIKGCLQCGNLPMARKLFDETPQRNVVSWTTMVNGYLQFGRVEVAERLFLDMPVRDVAAWNMMIYGYFQSGRVENAIKLFEEMPERNVISWTSMIRGLDQSGKGAEALTFFRTMLDCGIEPTASTFACVLTACANTFFLHLGVQVHGCTVKLGYYCFDQFICASLITFYASCKQIENAYNVFKEKHHLNVVIWTALLSGCSLDGKHEYALTIFGDMVRAGILPNQSSFSSALRSCCELKTLNWGREIHTMSIKLGLGIDSYVGNSLIVMYTGCGNIADALVVFKNVRDKNIVSLNSIIVGCAQHGHGMWALMFFGQMIRAEIDPDEITFTGLLSACGHCGMLQKARCFFEYISQYRSSEVKLQHYACMVDVLGRCGKLEEAEELIKNMPMKANSRVLLSLLGACRMHANLELAERAAKCILDIDPDCSSAYVLLSNVYASAGKWDDVSRMRVLMRRERIMKERGCSW